jgi:HupE / UreJ protein
MALARRVTALAAALVLLYVPAAGAHPMPTSAVLLDIGSDEVGGEIVLPLDRLAVALDRPLSPAQAVGPLKTQLERYARSHVRAVGDGGRRWSVTVGDAHVDGNDLVMSLTLTPPDGRVTDFDLHYDVIIDQLVTHRAIATQWSNATSVRRPETLGVFDWSTKSLHVDADGGSWMRRFAATVGLGVQHISEGADHLLFLLMLLIPAPLVVRHRRWRPGDDGRRSLIRVVHVVTAFAIGHSITLALATLGLIHVPERLVESLIALSILVSAVHALRPLVPRGEPIIAAGFGLVHGLAFATLLGDLGMSGGALVTSLLGFNLGIELTQLLVVALMMPSLYVLSQTRAYGVLRPGLALFGLVLAAAWLLERTTLIGSDPFAAVSTAAIDHPFTVAGVFALVAVCARYLATWPRSLEHVTKQVVEQRVAEHS